MPTQLLHCTMLGVLLLFFSCRDDNKWDSSTTPYEPVYNADPATKQVRFLPPRATIRGGNLYTTSFYVLEEEKDSGLHVISYLDPLSPKKLGFISIPGCRAVAVKDNYLYVSNYDDLVTINLDNITDMQETSRIAAAWHLNNYPPFTNVLFICPDSSKGTIVAWQLSEDRTGTDAKCRR